MNKISPEINSILNGMKAKNAKIGQILGSKPKEEAEEKKTKPQVKK